MFGNCIFTATGSSRPVGEALEDKMALWTCPIEAAANGTRSKLVKLFAQEGPRAAVMTC